MKRFDYEKFDQAIEEVLKDYSESADSSIIEELAWEGLKKQIQTGQITQDQAEEIMWRNHHSKTSKLE